MTRSGSKAKDTKDDERRRLDSALEEGLEESFPASDPPTSPSHRHRKATERSTAKIDAGAALEIQVITIYYVPRGRRRR